MRSSGRLCKCGHGEASHHRREDWCSAAVEKGDSWASDRYLGSAQDHSGANEPLIELFECRCERFTRRHRDRVPA